MVEMSLQEIENIITDYTSITDSYFLEKALYIITSLFILSAYFISEKIKKIELTTLIE